MSLRTLEDLGDLAGKRVVVRCDLNVPLKDGKITDDGRVRASLGTLNTLVNAGARVIVISHLGRPDGSPAPEYSLTPVGQRLSELLGKEVTFVGETVGDDATAAAEALGDGDVLLLENLRFNPEETSKDASERQQFAERIAALGDAFVSDGFGVVHRKQASVFELAAALPSAAGSLIESELTVLERLTKDPERPYTVVLGGSKVSDKLGVIDHLLPQVDTLCIGGGMLFTFLAAQGHGVAKSLLEQDQLDTVRSYLAKADELGVTIDLPTDVVVASGFAADAEHETVAADAIESTAFGADGIGLDIGPETAARFAKAVSGSKTVFWNGPMGVFEFPAFAAGTKTVAQALTEVDGLGVVGGGDSAAAVRSLGFADDRFGHISTGGGASLEFLEGKSLPGLEALGWSR
ncbi:phosphoglycerate kinase [Curtobacterium citreum]|uniref:Phosphoglycerate kinase n=1 Tax=Curtobacterium citreum TaxID=2036 RepID=A0ABT2HDF6_9MICO|nr:phosphoglycerate kinase [Curtobacterium citreum]MCS6521293.1 phosphoglycerate kinase [Curtobacterium citreum]TQJ28150.1 phosphoglycerate kinase [Curtobacterium citreum]GGL69059.1 phosphoglycerate kinase [Curtobacterium citreum]